MKKYSEVENGEVKNKTEGNKRKRKGRGDLQPDKKEEGRCWIGTEEKRQV